MQGHLRIQIQAHRLMLTLAGIVHLTLVVEAGRNIGHRKRKSWIDDELLGGRCSEKCDRTEIVTFFIPSQPGSRPQGHAGRILQYAAVLRLSPQAVPQS